ncbi:MAG TPA: ATP-binding protein [Polyangiaceae bacterium]|jgi:PAS domain S-box-containing protein|nr:ATP-binding protein [Polyangiaceae bacterium]
MVDMSDPSRLGDGRRVSSIPPSVREAWTASVDRYRVLVEAADDAILVADFDSGMVLEANPAACELLGYAPEQFKELGVRSLYAEGDEDIAPVLDEIASRERAWHPNLRPRRRDGTSLWADLRATVFESGGEKRVLYILRDVSHRVERESELARAYQSLKDAQAKLVHSGKLAAIGQIAGGVAHEVNNPATFILTNLRVMRESVAVLRRSLSRLRRELSGDTGLLPTKQSVVDAILAEGELETLLRDVNEMVDDNLSGIERIASIVKDLRMFSRIERDDVQEVRVNDIVDVACNLAYADIRHRARLIKQLTKLPPVLGEPGKLAQVFTNLLLNAAQAIEEGAANQNEIRVSTYREGTRIIVVAIEDTGASISEDARARMFEPFSMTKSDHGAGLGLSLCADIVRLHGGTIDVACLPDRGTRFVVRLPAQSGGDSSPPPDEKPSGPSSQASRRARILVIDDDLAVLRAYRRMLSARHDVVLASGGAEGIAVLEKDDAFDLILCDVMMPQVDGPMVYEALSSRFPDVLKRLVFCSGGAFTSRAKEFLASVENAFLAKPIDPVALEEVIERARARRAAAS